MKENNLKGSSVFKGKTEFSNIYVTKRDGSKQLRDVSKIKKIFQRAAIGLDVNVLELESSLTSVFYPNITTKDIHWYTISNALNLASIENPDWLLFAGRLMLDDIRKESLTNYRKITKDTKDDKKSLYQIGLYQFIQHMIKSGMYSDELNKFSKEEVEDFELYLDEKRDSNYGFSAVSAMYKKSLVSKDGDIIELPQYMFMIISMLIYKNETSFKKTNIKHTYDCLSKRELSLSSPFLSNLRVPDGNLSSCFIQETPDDIEGINYTMSTASIISKFGGGLGWYVGNIRAGGSAVGNYKNASNNIMMWIRIFNDIAVAVNQGGKRKGAFTLALDVYHKDIISFIEMGSETKEQRLTAHDVFPQIVLNNLFLTRVKNKQDFTLVCPYEVKKVLGIKLNEYWGKEFEEKYKIVEENAKNGNLKNVGIIKANELWKLILEGLIETGNGYTANKDNINKMNPNKDHGIIKAVNLCVESFSNFKPSKNYIMGKKDGERVNQGDGLFHTCNLVSLNLAEILNNNSKLEHAVRTAVRLLDSSIDITQAPVYESNQHNKMYRTIGIGTMGIADWMAYNKLSYHKPQDYKKLDELYEKIAYYAFDESINLAKRKEPFLAYKYSELKKGKILNKTLSQMKKMSNKENNLDWETLYSKLKKYGIRNSQLLAIAPNTSSSLVQECSASYLPVFKKSYFDKSSKFQVPVIAKFIKSRYHYYPNMNQVDQLKIIKLTTVIQKWIDTGISMEINLNPFINPNIKEFSDALIDAYLNYGLKTTYYMRIVQENSQKGEVACEGCAG